jgi:uncharacterized membrane protein YfcA
MLTNPKVVFSFTAISFLMFFTEPAYAYLDPGTGSMILQAVIGAIVGSAVAIKIFWKRIKHFFLRLIGKAKEAE